MSKLKIFKDTMPEQFEKLIKGDYDDFEVLVQIRDEDGTKVLPITMINFDEKLRTIWFCGVKSKKTHEYFEELYKMHQGLRKKSNEKS